MTRATVRLDGSRYLGDLVVVAWSLPSDRAFWVGHSSRWTGSTAIDKLTRPATGSTWA